MKIKIQTIFIVLILLALASTLFLLIMFDKNKTATLNADTCKTYLASYQLYYESSNISSWTEEEKNSFIASYNLLSKRCNEIYQNEN